MTDAMFEVPGWRLTQITDELRAARDHVAADHEALRRCWQLAEAWDTTAPPYPPTAPLYAGFAADLRAAITGPADDGKEAGDGPRPGPGGQG